MKRLLICILCLMPLVASAQSDSTAIRIVNRYLDIMNIDALPQDSMLVVNTTITYPTTGDTLYMKRLYAPPQMFRVEVRLPNGTLQTGLCSNGKKRFRVFSPNSIWWRDITPESFYSRLSGFDLRGPLYNWQSSNAYLTYRGRTEYKGQQMDVVHFTAPGFFNRLYMFESSGLLSLIIEEDSVNEGSRPLDEAHIEWKCEHEYTNVGPVILPSLESFMREKTLTVLRSEMKLEKRDNLQFNQD